MSGMHEGWRLYCWCSVINKLIWATLKIFGFWDVVLRFNWSKPLRSGLNSMCWWWVIRGYWSPKVVLQGSFLPVLSKWYSNSSHWPCVFAWDRPNKLNWHTTQLWATTWQKGDLYPSILAYVSWSDYHNPQWAGNSRESMNIFFPSQCA